MTKHNLEIVKPRGGAGAVVVGSEAFKRMFDLCCSKEVAQYMYDQTEAYLKRAGIFESEPYQQILVCLRDLVEYQTLAEDSGKIWQGEPASTAFQNVQFQKAVAFLDKLDASKPIQFDFAVGDQAELVGVFTVDGQPLNAATETGMTNLLLAWLSQNQLLNKDGVIYEATASGDIRQRDGQEVIANPGALRQQILDEKTGLAAYVQQKNKEVQLTLEPHNYAESQVTTEPTVDSR